MTYWNQLCFRINNNRLFKYFRKVIGASWPLYPKGHFHSTIPSIHDLQQNSAITEDIIDYNDEQQLSLLNRFKSYYGELPFSDRRSSGLYFYDNPYFSYSDAIVYFCMLRSLKVNKILEFGTGMSTACFLDTQAHLDSSIDFVSVDLSMPSDADILATLHERENCTFINSDIRQLNSRYYESLQKDDILFVDSSHVSKYGSDVNHIIFEILPKLKSGVVIHFHDVFRHFEYPAEWLEEGIYWNEQYILRAFLMNNSEYEIILFSDYMEQKYEDWYRQYMPLCLQAHEKYLFGPNKGKPITHIKGQSLWIRKK